MNLDIKHTNVLTRNLKALEDGYRFIVNQGGSSSSKTVSILQLLIWIAMTQKVRISVVRKGFPTLRKSTMDGDWGFFHILKDLNIYNKQFHNKSSNTYFFEQTGSIVEFFSIDDEQKLRGPRRDILYCNEGNEIDELEFNQLVMRTRGKVFIDFNPSDVDHWLYEFMKGPDCILIKSNYKDNLFLNDVQVKYIENLINSDENYYKIYALGERPTSTTRVYSHFKHYVDEPDCPITSYGLDLGWNDPTVLTEIRDDGERLWVKEIIYESGLTTQDLINKMKDLNIDKKIPIFCDHRPEIIEDISRNGFYIKSADKSKKIVGIDYIKSKEVFIHHDSTNGIKETKMYSWKTDKKGVLQDEVVDGWDHFLDSFRYGAYSNRRQNYEVDHNFY